MLFVELAAQAVRGFTPSVRVALRPGYVALQSPASLPAPLAGLVSALCFPDGRGGDLAFLAPGAKAGRAGLSIQGKGQSVWRVVRDLGGAGGLHRLNPKTNQYEVVTQDALEVAQVMRTEVGFPGRTAFDHVFSFNGAQLPSRRPKQPKAAAPKPKLSTPHHPDLPELQRRIGALEQELASARQAQELQFSFDGLQGELFNAESQLRAHEELKAKVAAAREELGRAPTPKSLGLPDDIVQRVHRFGDEKKRRNEALAKLAAEQDQALDPRALVVDPLRKDRRFWAALVVGLALLVLGGLLEGGARYVALLAIPAFTVAMVIALRFIEDLQRQSREQSKGEVFAQREKKVRDDFELSTMMVKAAFDKTATETPDEFSAALVKRDELAPALMELELQLADLESDPATLGLPDRVAEMKAELELLNQRLLMLSGGYVREVREIERELAPLKEAAAPPAPVTQDFTPVSVGPAETFDDPIPAVMQLGAELFNTDITTLWSLLKDRSVQYLKALTDQRYHGIDVVAEGRSKVMAPGREVPAGELPARDIDLLYLSIRLTLVEKYSAQDKFPLIIEDSFGGVIDESKQSLLGRMLKHIGSLTQVLHVTGVGQNVAAADVVVQL
jgi:hypothetical protein